MGHLEYVFFHNYKTRDFYQELAKFIQPFYILIEHWRSFYCDFFDVILTPTTSYIIYLNQNKINIKIKF